MIAMHPQQYGVPWLATNNGLANLQIGGANQRQVDFFHRCAASKTLSNISLFIKTGAGYSGGTGGAVKVEVQSDDGTALHRPSGTVLATVTVTTPITSQVLTWTFPGGLAQQAGTLYHYVMTNTDASPTVNFVSEDDFDTATLNPRQRGSSDADLGVMMNDASAGWAINTGHSPCCFDLQYSDGSHDGVGFFDALSGSGLRDIGGANNAVRMNFTPAQGMLVNRCNAGYYKQAGSTIPVDFELYVGASKIAAGQAPASAAQVTSPNWVGAALPFTPLQKGVNYTLQLWSRSETVNYKAFPLQAGGAGFGALFLSQSIFADGYWEYTTNAGGAWNLEGASQAFKPMLYFEMVDQNAEQFQGRGDGPVLA